MNGLTKERREKYFDLHPDREEGEEEDTSGRSASFLVKEDLNRIAASRWLLPMENGYSDGKIPGQGDLSEYLSSVSYRPHATCLELYLRRCEDGEEAWEKRPRSGWRETMTRRRTGNTLWNIIDI